MEAVASPARRTEAPLSHMPAVLTRRTTRSLLVGLASVFMFLALGWVGCVHAAFVAVQVVALDSCARKLRRVVLSFTGGGHFMFASWWRFGSLGLIQSALLTAVVLRVFVWRTKRCGMARARKFKIPR
jgi:hypothetical protein